MGHGDEEQGDSAEDEQGEGGAGAGKGPGVVVFNPDGLVTVNHALDRLAHYFDRNDDAKACKGKEHPSRPEQVVTPLPEGEDDTECAHYHEEQTEDGDGCR